MRSNKLNKFAEDVEEEFKNPQSNALRNFGEMMDELNEGLPPATSAEVLCARMEW